MSAKRSAQYELDQKTLQPKAPLETPKESSKTDQPTQTYPERNILAVKKDNNNQHEPSNKLNETNPQQKPASTGLFSINFNQPIPTNGNGLFSNGTTGLFNNNNSSLFSNNNTGSNLFSKSTGLFGSTSTSNSQARSGGLFGSSGTSAGSIFNFQNGGVPPVKQGSLFGAKGNQDEDSGDSAQLEAGQNLDVDPSKSQVNYNYESTCTLILKQKAFKFKKIGNDLIQNVDVVITYDKNTKLYYISIQLPATKRSIYSGVIIGKKSQVKHLNNKKQNVEISAFNILKGKPEQAVLRCQFQKEAQGVEVHDTVDKIIQGTYVLKEEETVKQEQKEQNNETQKEEGKKEDAKTEEVKKEDVNISDVKNEDAKKSGDGKLNQK